MLNHSIQRELGFLLKLAENRKQLFLAVDNDIAKMRVFICHGKKLEFLPLLLLKIL